MIAKPKATVDGDGTRKKWKVFVDSEKSGIVTAQLQTESPEHPLPERFRFTVAHELAHTLGFRASEFGVDIERAKRTKESDGDVVSALEAETNRLAPLLLVSDTGIQKLCDEVPGELTLGALLLARSRWAVSRSVLVSRLNLLAVVDDKNLRNRRCLTEVIVGLGEWQSSTSAILAPWPLYISLGNPFVPEFVLRLRSKGSCTLSEIVALDAVRAADKQSLEYVCEVPVGTTQNPKSELVPIRFTFEDTPRKAGQAFLYLVQPAKV